MTTERENALNVYLHGKGEWVPSTWRSCFMCDEGIACESGPTDENGVRHGGMDLWGINWVCEGAGDGQPTPDFNQAPILEDIEDWRDVVKFPDMDALDWEGAAKKQAERYDGTKLLCYFDTNGLYNRLCWLMGTEEALCAIVTDPDEVRALVHEIANVKIALVNNVATYLKPDLFDYMDDIASAAGLMISPEAYREIFKPEHRRIVQAIRDRGMIAEQHMCGKMDAVADDLVEIGIQGILPLQPTNDIAGIHARHPDLVLHGCAEAQSAEFSVTGTEETGREEARRVMREWGRTGRLFGYISRAQHTPAHTGFFEEFDRIGATILKEPAKTLV